MEETLERVLIRKAAQRKIPLTVNMELLPLCNLACDMCYIRLSKKEMQQRGKMLSAEAWMDIARQAAGQGVLFILMTGGEPLLFPQFQKLYCELKRLGMFITVNTNGTLVDEAWADFFGKYRPRRVNVTLYGASNETYAKLCHEPKGFERAISGIKRLKERNIDVKINISVAKKNAEEVDAIYEIGQELDIPVFADTYLLPSLKEQENNTGESPRLNAKQAAGMQVHVLKRQMGERFAPYVHVVLEQVAEGETYPTHMDCQAGCCSCAIDWQGRMRPCVTLKEPFIDLKEVSFAKGWEQLQKKVAGLTLNQKCSTCHLRPICPTCVGSAKLETGTCDGESEYVCEYTRELFRLYQKEGTF